MTQILDGKKYADEIIAQIKEERRQFNYPIKLGIVFIGDNPASASYVNQKQKIGAQIGIKVKVYKYDKNSSTRFLRGEIGAISRKPNIRGVIVQLPIPENINTDSILNAVLPEVDVDVLSVSMSGKMYIGKAPIMPPTIAGAITLLEKNNVNITGATIAIIGNGRLVGRPAALLLSQMGASVIMADTRVPKSAGLIKNADIIISGVGKPEIITGDMVKEGCAIIDAGFSKIGDEIVGDVAQSAAKKAEFYAPAKGGVGPLTVAFLFKNVLTLARLRQQKVKI